MIKPKNIINKIVKINNSFFHFSQSHISSIYLLVTRLWVADIFFKSGSNKFSNMDNTIYLFEYEYFEGINFISPVLSAYSATFFELICSVLLAFGLITRLAVLPLIVITLVIQFFVIQNTEHFYWLFLLCSIFAYGAGSISVDRKLKIK